MKEQVLVDQEYLLEKFPGKGGWTYARIPEVLQNPSAPFGWVTVKGWIDDYELRQFKLMPMGDGQSLFVPVKAAIRKKIGKQAGDYVRIVLYPDHSELEIPEEILDCFANEDPALFETFKSFTQGQQKAYLDWIDAAKREETRVNRIVEMMERLVEGLKR